MKSILLIKQVNNTELGKGGTHETYILIPQDLNVSDIFEENNVKYSFVDKDSLKEYKIRLTSGREKRIVGLGPFYSDKIFLPEIRFCSKRDFFKTEKFIITFPCREHQILCFFKKYAAILKQ